MYNLELIRGIKYKATFLLLLTVALMSAQNTLHIRLNDPYKRPVPYAGIRSGTISTVTDEKGLFSLPGINTPVRIRIHKFGFTDTVITLQTPLSPADTIELNIRLSLKATFLPEITINASRINEINPLKSDFVIGYELEGEHLIELLSNDVIVVVDKDNFIKARSSPLKGMDDLQRDPAGRLNLVTNKAAFKFLSVSPQLRVDTAVVDLTSFKRYITYCDQALDTSFFVRRYKDNNQTVAFFAISGLHRNHMKLLKEISDAERKYAVQTLTNETNGLLMYLKRREEKNPAAMMGELTQNEMKLYNDYMAMAAFLSNNYAPPSYSVLRMVNDSIYLFAHDIDSMFVYDRNWKEVKSRRINYHRMKYWDKELIVNEERTKVFARLLKDSKPVIAEVDLQTGALKGPYISLGSNFPKRIRIRNNMIYYMAKQKGGIGYTVYSQEMGE